MRIKYLIPGYYLIHSRLKRKSEQFSFLYVFPLFLGVFIYLELKIAQGIVEYFFSFLIAFLSWVSSYEIGYIENDTQTIKSESNPTLRLEPDEITYLQKSYSYLVWLKFIISVLLLGILWLINFSELLSLNLPLFVFVICIARLFFYAHNNIRSRWNILTYFSLSTIKYFSIPILFISFFNHLSFYAGLILVFPIIRTAEHASKIKYRIGFLKPIASNLDKFRVGYYFVSILLIFILYLMFDLKSIEVILFMFGWFLVYRLALLIVLKFTDYKRTHFDSHNS